jgi:Tfp pilus assembly PilM family ATPase
MNFPFVNQCNGQIGISFQDNEITIGQCAWKHGRYVHPTTFHVQANPSEICADDWRDYMSRAGISGTECVITLPTSLAHHYVLRLPSMEETEIKEAAAWEVADRLGIERSMLALDAMPIGRGGDVLAVAIEHETISNLLDPLYAAGLQPTRVEPQCVALARTLSMLHRRQNDQATVRSVFDFGTNDSAFMVLAGDGLVFYKHLDHCGDALIAAISKHTGVTREQAIGMLAGSNDCDDTSSITRAVRDATRSTHESIATDAMKCLRHYGVTNRGPLSSQTIITGSAGWNQHLSSVLSSTCNQDVIPDFDVQHIQGLSKEIVDTNGWQIALGASLAKINLNKQRRVSDFFGREAA